MADTFDIIGVHHIELYAYDSSSTCERCAAFPAGDWPSTDLVTKHQPRWHSPASHVQHDRRDDEAPLAYAAHGCSRALYQHLLRSSSAKRSTCQIQIRIEYHEIRTFSLQHDAVRSCRHVECLSTRFQACSREHIAPAASPGAQDREHGS